MASIVLVRRSWARLEILAGLLQEVLLISLSLSIIVEAVNKIINPHHIEDAMAMIYLGSASVFIGLLGLLLFRGYHHDHNISHEIDEQKKNDFVRSVHTTLRNLDRTSEHSEKPLLDRRTMPTMSLPITVPELVVTGSTTSISNNNSYTTFNKPVTSPQELILPSLNETYQSAFIVSDPRDSMKQDRLSDTLDQQLRVPESTSMEFTRMRSRSGDSVMSSTFALNQNPASCDDEFQESRVYATLHALSLHSLVGRHLFSTFSPTEPCELVSLAFRPYFSKR